MYEVKVKTIFSKKRFFLKRFSITLGFQAKKLRSVLVNIAVQSQNTATLQ